MACESPLETALEPEEEEPQISPETFAREVKRQVDLHPEMLDCVLFVVCPTLDEFQLPEYAEAIQSAVPGLVFTVATGMPGINVLSQKMLSRLYFELLVERVVEVEGDLENFDPDRVVNS